MRPPPTARARGVTLIELLVVVAILAILVALLFPVARRVIHSSRQTVCAANLRELGLAAQQYITDNNGEFFDGGRMSNLNPYINRGKVTDNTWWASSLFRKALISCPAVNALPGTKYNSGIYGINYVFVNTIQGPRPPDLPPEEKAPPPATWPLRLLNVPKPQKAWLFTEASRCNADGSLNIDPLSFIAYGAIDTKPGSGVSTLLWPHPAHPGGRKNFVFLDGHVESLSWQEVKDRTGAWPGQEYKEFHGLTGNR